MGAPDILAALLQKGLTLTADGQNIRIEPKSKLTDEARSLIRNHKSDLLAHLTCTEPTKEPLLDPTKPHWAWRLTYPDESTQEQFTLPEATHAEILNLWPEMIAAEPFKTVNCEAKLSVTPLDRQTFVEVMRHYQFDPDEIKLAWQAHENDPTAGKRTYAALRAAFH